MVIYHAFACVFCNKENKITIIEDERGALQMKKGNELPYICKYCHKKSKIHINKIVAYPSKTFRNIAIILSFVFMFFLLDYGLIYTGILAIPISINFYQKHIADLFNYYKIKE